MSKDSPQPQQSEEVDLGQLFKAIGSIFDRLFKFIARISIGLLNILILLLLFVQKHFLKFVVAGALGIAVGVYLDYKKEPKYISTMVLEPNFNSVQQLYNNINFYNELAKSEDSVALSEALDITKREASYLKELSIESYSDENQKIKLFDEFLTSLDTTTQKAIDVDAYLENFNSLDARFHTVSVVASNKRIAKKIQLPILNSISNNEYFNLQKKINESSIKLQDSVFTKQFTEIDSLQALYRTVMLKEAARQEGTTISLGENGKKENKELSLINKLDEIKYGLVRLNEERANKSSILNVISDFPNEGVKISGILKSYKFLVPCGFLGLTALFFALVSLNTFLKNYKRK